MTRRQPTRCRILRKVGPATPWPTLPSPCAFSEATAPCLLPHVWLHHAVFRSCPSTWGRSEYCVMQPDVRQQAWCRRLRERAGVGKSRPRVGGSDLSKYPATSWLSPRHRRLRLLALRAISPTPPRPPSRSSPTTPHLPPT